MKKTRIYLLTLALVFAAGSAFIVLDYASAATIKSVVDSQSVSAPTTGSDISAFPIPSVNTLSAEEIDGLLFMREEEKLARDVYLTLYDRWNLNIFQNIAMSENTHMDAIQALLERYGLDDPAADKGIGKFTNPDLQALYDQLVAQGEQSLSDAIKTGAMIEEIDILDLEERIAQTQTDDIVAVYESLTKGSRNHLRSFTKTLEQQTGEIYAPEYLSQDTYEAIIGSGIESGGNNNGNRSENGSRRGRDW